MKIICLIATRLSARTKFWCIYRLEKVQYFCLFKLKIVWLHTSAELFFHPISVCESVLNFLHLLAVIDVNNRFHGILSWSIDTSIASLVRNGDLEKKALFIALSVLCQYLCSFPLKNYLSCNSKLTLKYYISSFITPIRVSVMLGLVEPDLFPFNVRIFRAMRKKKCSSIEIYNKKICNQHIIKQKKKEKSFKCFCHSVIFS